MYKRSLRLAPGYDEAYLHYSELLFAQRRRGEALALIEHARGVDPFSAALAWRKAHLVLAINGDVAKHERLLQEALLFSPTFVQPLRDLASAVGIRRGQFAEGIGYLERAIALDPGSILNVGFARTLYLDLGDVDAARSVLRESNRSDDPFVRAQWIPITQYQGDTRGAAQLAKGLLQEWLVSSATFDIISTDHRIQSIAKESVQEHWPVAAAVRDEAILSGDFATALDLLGRTYALRTDNEPIRFRSLTLTYAHTLMSSGETRRARELLTRLLEQLDAESIGRPEYWFASERAAAFAILGEDERSIKELIASVERRQLSGWWYTAKHDPVYARIREDSRFQALVAKVTQHRNQQRALLDELRRKGQVPRRG